MIRGSVRPQVEKVQKAPSCAFLGYRRQRMFKQWKMIVFILCLPCVVGITSGNFIDIVRHELQKDDLQKDASNVKSVCLVEAALTNCVPALISATHARRGTICRYVDQDMYAQCQRDGSWQVDVTYKAMYDYGAVRKYRYFPKKKRFWGILAAAVGIGCVIFCHHGGHGGGGGGGQSKPNSFPEITCPTIHPQHATTGTSMAVTWIEPVGHDKEDGTIEKVQRTGSPPGSNFDEGTHIITYRVTDKEGFPASCQVIFSVKASYCLQLPWPRDGTRQCTNRDISGSTCTFDCDQGYEIQGSNSVRCSAGGWSGVIPKCQAKSCGPTPSVANGTLTCLGDTVYGTYCLLTCKRGYESQGLLFSMCSKSGHWTSPGTCIDLSTPAFTFGCPEDVTEYAKKKDRPNSVTWSDPNVTDVSAVTITYNPIKGSLFFVGQTSVTAVATDPNGNTARCSFSVNINSLYCPEPDLGDNKLMYACPDGYGYGFSCYLSCHSGYPLNGSNSILCEKNSAPNLTTSWTWPDDSVKPFCGNTTCPALRVPSNGAMSCEGWTNGQMCTMMCNEEYDVPRNVPDMYVCGEQSGTWRPSDHVYDCTVKRRAGQMKLASEFYYYSGSCQDADTRRAIAESYIHILNTSTTFTDVCGATVPECRPKLVDVYCGTTTRKKRDGQHALFKKETVGIIIHFDIYTGFEVKPGEDFTAVRTRKENLLNSASDAVDQMLSGGELNMKDKGVTVQPDSHRPGVPEFNCDDGEAYYEKGTCRGCPTGTYTDVVSDQCVDCPVGTYSDGDFAHSCKSCGEGMSTKTTKSKSVNNCTAMCSAGSYSHDGMVPCTPCDPGAYQDAVGATSCKACPAATTSTQGADEARRCVAFDLKITVETDWGEMTSDMASFTLVYWFRVFSSARSTLSAVKDSLGNTIVSLSVANTLHVVVDGNTVDTGASPITDRWQHVTLTIDGSTKNMTVYLNGNEAYTGRVTSLSSSVVPQGSTLTSDPTSGDIHLSGIGVIGRVVSPEEVQSSAGSCLASWQDSGLKSLISGQKLVPSLCDAVDDCSASPCGSHPCIDEIGDFSCDCQDGWTGTTCDTPPDYCAHHECKHGAVCENGKTNYTCKCLKGFKGELCQGVIVNGQWSEWTKWTKCSVTCNGGSKTRRRVCDSPPPDDDGDDCVGAAGETVSCKPEPCPVCPPLSLSLGNEKNCSEEDGLNRCKVTCRVSMVFANSDIVPPVYECGLTTGYTWNHQIDNKSARPPSCKKAVGASQYAARHTVRYSNLPCDLASQKASEVRSQVSTTVNDLHCVKDGICTASSSLLPCKQSTAGKRSVLPATVVITIAAKMDNSISADLEVLAFNGTITSNLEDYVNKVLNTDLTVQILVNNSDTLLQLTLGGAVYNIDPDTMTTMAVISCPDGTVPADGACGECSAGTRQKDNICVPCEKGTFQDQAASATCQPCPQGTTTLGSGSTQVTDCSIHADEDGDHDDDKERESILLLVLAPTITGALILIAIALFLVWKMKGSKSSSRPPSSRSTRKIQVHPAQDDTPPPYTPPPYTPPSYTNNPDSQPRPVSAQGVVISQTW